VQEHVHIEVTFMYCMHSEVTYKQLKLLSVLPGTESNRVKKLLLNKTHVHF